MGEFLQYGICRHIYIKDFLPKQASFFKYIWEVLAYMVITGEVHSGPDICPKTCNQSTSTEDMILTIWYKKAMKQIEINPQQYYLQGLSAKKACSIS